MKKTVLCLKCFSAMVMFGVSDDGSVKFYCKNCCNIQSKYRGVADFNNVFDDGGSK